MELTSTAPMLSTANTTPTTDTFGDLRTQDFLELLIIELRQQDPLEPVGNEELLQQIASVREIELSTALTDSLTKLSNQQRIASASGLIGQFVTGVMDESGAAEQGIVVGVRFAQDGRPILQLANGGELPLEKVAAIESPIRAAEALVGQMVIGVDRRDLSQPQAIEGVVTGVRLGDQGDVTLELDTGTDVRFQDVIGVVSNQMV